MNNCHPLYQFQYKEHCQSGERLEERYIGINANTIRKNPCIEFNKLVIIYAASHYSKRFIDDHYDGMNIELSKERHQISQIEGRQKCEKIPECSEKIKKLLSEGYRFCSL